MKAKQWLRGLTDDEVDSDALGQVNLADGDIQARAGEPEEAPSPCRASPLLGRFHPHGRSRLNRQPLGDLTRAGSLTVVDRDGSPAREERDIRLTQHRRSSQAILRTTCILARWASSG